MIQHEPATDAKVDYWLFVTASELPEEQEHAVCRLSPLPDPCILGNIHIRM